MSIKDFVARQKARAAYLVERVLTATEEASGEGGVLPKLPAKNERRRMKDGSKEIHTS